MLDDEVPVVRWDTAVSLAKLGDAKGRDILLQLLDQKYFTEFPEILPEKRAWVMEVAVRSAALLNDPDLNGAIKTLSASAPDLSVRNAALQMVEHLKI